jgi:hypothetical protein
MNLRGIYMRTLKRSAAVLAMATLIAGVAPVAAANAVSYVPTLSWANLHVKKQPGVFERFIRDFDAKEQLIADSETQHNTAWVRTDQKSVTVQYVGTAVNAGQQVKFIVDSDVKYTDNIAGDENIATVGADGVAELVITPEVAAKEDDSIRVDLGNGAKTVGSMLILFKNAGYAPAVKLVGTATGPEAVCDYKFDCQGSDLWEATYEWSVFKRGWLPEYAQVYAKSYMYGSTVGLKYRVTDIWGTPQVKKDVSLVVGGCSVCKWAKFVSKKATDKNGYAVFTLKNTNTKSQVLKYSSVNQDTKETGTGFLPFSINPTTNDLDESVDYIWPQIVPDMTIRSSAVALTVMKRGDVLADLSGNVISGSSANPALTLDPTGVAKTDQILVKFAVTYLRNAQANALYSPDVTVTATNGGVATLVTPSAPADTMTAIGKGANKLVFGYNSSNKKKDVQLMLTGTKVGTTTWTITIGGVKKTVTQVYKAK